MMLPLLACTDPPQVVVPPSDLAASARVAPPVTGGGLARVGDRIVASDTDGDRLLAVHADTHALAGVLALEPGDAPGRIAQDPDGNGYVVLGAAGAVASFTADPLALGWRSQVCAAPRGVAWDDDAGVLRVACASGVLAAVTADGRLLETPFVERDLADVVVADGSVWLATFRDAAILRRCATGVVDRFALPDSDFGQGTMRASVAWAMEPHPDGGVALLHQWRSLADVPIDVRDTGLAVGTAYGGVDPTTCSGVVVGGLSSVDQDGALRSRVAFGATPLAVDLARDDAGWLLAVAGTPGARVLALPDPATAGAERTGGLLPVAGVAGDHNVAVLVDEGRVWTLWRQPLAIAVDETRVALGLVADDPDPAFALFHRDAGAGIACASCHPDAGDDGQVWSFAGLGDRRTQPLRAAIGHTAPYHWDGEFAGLSDLMDEVFVGRMGGEPVDAAEVARLVAWLDALPVPRTTEPVAAHLADEGRAVFTAAGCASCHAPPYWTDGRTHDVGTGGAFQTPSLLGVSSRPPWMHDGCAATLRDRFSLPCGGAAHGDFLDLSDAEIDAILAFLGTL